MNAKASFGAGLRPLTDARGLAWLVAVGVALGAAVAYGQVADAHDAAPLARVASFAGLGLAGLLAVFWFPDGLGRRGALAALWIPAVLLRIALLPAAPSDDVHRYLWEGKLVAAGESPYAATADAPERRTYRDAHWQAMNHRSAPTAYPPLAQLVFAGIGAVAYTPLAFKLVFVAFDLSVLGALVAVLRRRGQPLEWSGLYALNPAPLVAFAAEAHFDALMVAALAAAIWAVHAGRARFAAGFAAAGTAAKAIALPLLPFFARRRDPSSWAAAAAVLALPALPFLASVPEALSGILKFGAERSFNGPVFDPLHRAKALDLPHNLTLGILAAAFIGVWACRWRLRDRAPADAHARWILGAFLILAPTVHFWYLAWILPFICLRPSAGWLGVSVSASVYFFVWHNAVHGDKWGLAPWQQTLFWAPLAAVFLYDVWSTRGTVLRSQGPDRPAPGQARSIDVVIPVYNAAEHLRACLDELARQTRPADAILVVDGGSDDDSAGVSHPDLPVRVLESELGRGQQIVAGLGASDAEWVLVLHADARPAPDALERLERSIEADPRAIGGVLGQRFDRSAFILAFVELLNDLRFLFTRTAFGDQAQFFHRATALKHNLMPAQPLMEDVEASWRLRERGDAIYVGARVVTDSSKWQSGRWPRRFALVIRLLGRYRWTRLRSRRRAERLAHQLYREYYGNPDGRCH